MAGAPPPKDESPDHRRGRDHRNGATGWRTRDILRTLALIAGFYLTLQLLWVGRPVVLLSFLGVLFGLALTAGVDRLERWRMSRGVGAVLIILAFLGVLVGIGALTAPSITGQLRELKTQLPEAVGKIQRWVRERQQGFTQVLEQVAPPDTAPADQAREESKPRDPQQRGEAGQQPEDTRPGISLGQGIVEQIGGVGRHFFSVFSSTLAVLGGLILILFVAIFVAIDAKTYHDGLMHLFPHEMRERAGEVLTTTATMLRRWLFAQLVSMMAVGTITSVVLLILDVKAAIALGIIAGILEFIPIAGPILSSVPAIAMGFLDGPEKALYIALAYVVIQQLEANLLYPLIMKKGVELPPVLTIVAQGVMAIVFGFLGLLVAVPMLAAATVPIKMLYVRDVVGDPVKLPGEEESKPEKRLPRADQGDANRGRAGEGLVVLLMALVPVAGCSSPQRKMEELNRTAHSWEATARLTKELWGKGAVPAEYAQQTIAAAEEELEKTRRRSGKPSQ
jgi:predicted PurR-regulated permease PerM